MKYFQRLGPVIMMKDVLNHVCKNGMNVKFDLTQHKN